MHVDAGPLTGGTLWRGMDHVQGGDASRTSLRHAYYQVVLLYVHTVLQANPCQPHLNLPFAPIYARSIISYGIDELIVTQHSN